MPQMQEQGGGHKACFVGEGAEGVPGWGRSRPEEEGGGGRFSKAPCSLLPSQRQRAAAPRLAQDFSGRSAGSGQARRRARS